MPSKEKIIDSFHRKALTPILGLPTLESMSVAHLELNTCAASVRSHRRNEKLGLFDLTAQSEVLDTLSIVKFVPPINPGRHSTIPAAATGLKTTNIRRVHKEQFDDCL